LRSSLEQQKDLVACCVCERGTGLGAGLEWVKKETDAVEFLENVAEACAEGVKVRERFARIRGMLEPAGDVKSMWLILEDWELPGMGSKDKGHSTESVEAAGELRPSLLLVTCSFFNLQRVKFLLEPLFL
jgi:hypothetical protein